MNDTNDVPAQAVTKGLDPKRRPLFLRSKLMDATQAAQYVGLDSDDVLLTEMRDRFIVLGIKPTKTKKGEPLWSEKDVLDNLPHDWPREIQYYRVHNGEYVGSWVYPYQICVPPGRRALDTEKVSGLVESIKQLGLLHPITVRKFDGEQPTFIDGEGEELSYKYELVAGAHRLEACKQLAGPPYMPVIVVDASPDVAKLMELDENLTRSELTPSQLADHITRRKEVFERIHGSTKARGAHAANASMGNQRDAGAKLADAFTADTAKATGMSERAVQRDAQRGKAIGTESLTKITGTSLDKGVELDALAKLPEAERTELVARAASGENVSARPVSGQKIITAEERKAQYAADETLATTPSGAPAEDDEERVATDLGLELLLSLKDLVETGSASNRINMVGFIRTAIINLAIDVTEVKKDASGAERRCAAKILKFFKTQEAKAA